MSRLAVSTSPKLYYLSIDPLLQDKVKEDPKILEFIKSVLGCWNEMISLSDIRSKTPKGAVVAFVGLYGSPFVRGRAGTDWQHGRKVVNFTFQKLGAYDNILVTYHLVHRMMGRPMKIATYKKTKDGKVEPPNQRKIADFRNLLDAEAAPHNYGALRL